MSANHRAFRDSGFDIFTKGLNGDKLSKHVKRVVINGSNESGKSLEKVVKSRGEDIEIDKMLPRVMTINDDLCERENNMPAHPVTDDVQRYSSGGVTERRTAQ